MIIEYILALLIGVVSGYFISSRLNRTKKISEEERMGGHREWYNDFDEENRP